MTPDKQSFYSELNKEGIIDEDYIYAQKVWDVFEIKILESIMTYTSKVMQYCLQKYMKTLGINALKYIN